MPLAAAQERSQTYHIKHGSLIPQSKSLNPSALKITVMGHICDGSGHNNQILKHHFMSHAIITQSKTMPNLTEILGNYFSSTWTFLAPGLF